MMPPIAVPNLLLILGGIFILLGAAWTKRDDRRWPVFAAAVLAVATVLMWTTPLAASDGFSRNTAVCLSVVGGGLCISLFYERRAHGTYAGYLLLTIAAIATASAATEWLDLLLSYFVALVLAWIPAVLVAEDSVDRSTARDWSLRQAGGFVFLAIAALIAMSYAPAGSQVDPGEPMPQLAATAVLMFAMAGVAATYHIAPFHIGALELLHRQSEWTVGTSLTLVRTAGVVVLLRLTTLLSDDWQDSGIAALLLVTVVTSLAATIRMLQETKLRPLLQQAAMAQVAWILFGLALASTHYIWPNDSSAHRQMRRTVDAHVRLEFWQGVLTLATLWVVARYLTRRDRSHDFLQNLAGLSRDQPLAAGCFVVLLGNLTGLPPTLGCWSRLQLMYDALLAHRVDVVPLFAQSYRATPEPQPAFLLVTCFLAVQTAVLWIAVFRVISLFYFQPPLGAPSIEGGPGRLAFAGVVALAAMASPFCYQWLLTF